MKVISIPEPQMITTDLGLSVVCGRNLIQCTDTAHWNARLD